MIPPTLLVGGLNLGLVLQIKVEIFIYNQGRKCDQELMIINITKFPSEFHG